MNGKEIYTYIRDRKSRHPIGIIVARDDHGIIKFGWSQCNRKAGDKFDIEEGLIRARARMIEPDPIPIHIQEKYFAIQRRAMQYFKGAVMLDTLAINAYQNSLEKSDVVRAVKSFKKTVVPVKNKKNIIAKKEIKAIFDEANGVVPVKKVVKK